MIQLLLNKGAGQNHSDKGGWTVLRVAVSSGHESAAWLLLAKVPDQNRWGEGGRAVLLWAAGKGYKEVQAFRATMDTLRSSRSSD